MTIKTLAIRTMAMLAFTLTLGACSENENEMPDNTPSGEKMTITAGLPGADTRVEYGNPTIGGVEVSWTEHDKLMLYKEGGSNDGIIYTIVKETISPDGKTASFEGEPLAEGGYYVFGPAQGNKIPANDADFRFSFLDQVQSKNNNLGHLPAYDLIVSMFSTSNPNKLNFMHVGSLFQFNLTDLPVGTYNKFTIKSSHSEGILCDVKTLSSNYSYQQEFPVGLSDITLTENETLTVWAILPISYNGPVFQEGTLTLEVTGEGEKTYTNVTPITIPEGGLSYIRGERYTMTTAMQEQQTGDPLTEFLDWAQNDGWRNENFTLTGNIDLTGWDWTPIGSSLAANRFTKTFDGGGYTISGLNVNKSTTSNVGLFGYIGNGGIVRNVTVKGSVLGNESAGGISGINFGTISGCTFQGTVTANNPYTGGIAGSNYGLVVGCRVTQSTIKGSKGNIGGIAGGNDEGGSNIACLVDNVTLEGYNAGGIVGEQYDGSIVACVTSLAKITPPSIPPINATYGGIAASNYGVTISTCYWQTGTGYSKGLGSDGDSQQSNCISFVSGSFPSNGVGKLNTAINTWNGANGGKCPFQWEAGSTLPTLSPKK